MVIYFDFGSDYIAAKEWALKNYVKWEKSLTNEEKEAVYKYSVGTDFYVNGYLDGTYKPPNQQQKTFLDNLIYYVDKALKKAAIPENLVLYKRASITELQLDAPYTDCDLRPDGLTLDLDVVSFIIDAFTKNKKLLYPTYMDTNLAQDIARPLVAMPILLKINVRDGLPAAFVGNINGYVNEGEMVVKRRSTLQLKNFIRITDQGIETLKIEADLL